MTTQQDLGVAASPSYTPSPTQAAFERALAAAMALPADEVVAATTNTPDAIVRVFSALPGLRTLLGDARRALTLYDPSTLDQFELHAHALSYAQSRYLQSRSPTTVDAARAANKAQAALSIALSDLQAMLNREMVDPARVASIKRSIGTRESLPIAIGAVIQLMTELRKTYGDRLLMTEAEQNELAQLGAELSQALAGAVVVMKAEDNPLDTRNRMFTLLRRDYLELRRTVEYLRFYEDDADEFLPTIFTRAKRKGRAEGTDSDSASEKKPAQPEPRALALDAEDTGVPQEDPFAQK